MSDSMLQTTPATLGPIARPARGRILTAARPLIAAPVAAILLALAAPAAPTFAQDGRPAARPADAAGGIESDDADQDAGAEAERPAAANQPAAPPAVVDAPDGEGDQVILNFDDVSIDQIIPFIVRTTGKVVILLNEAQLKAKKITLMNTQKMPRQEALNLLSEALRLNDVALIETDDLVILDVTSHVPEVATRGVLGPDVDIRARRDKGNFIIKVFEITKAEAGTIAEMLDENLRPQFATIMVDENSNRLIVSGTVSYCQYVQDLIDQLDVPPHVLVRTSVIRLKHADAGEISTNVLEIYEEDESSDNNRAGSRQARIRQAASARRGGGEAGTAEFGPGPKAELRVSYNSQQNSVIIQGDPGMVGEIEALIYDLDQPLAAEATRIYDLVYTDPIKMRDLLQEALEGGGGTGGNRAGGNRAGGARGGTGQAGDVSTLVGSIFKIHAYPDSNRLFVISKSEANFEYLDQLIQELDQPLRVGLPQLIELKHANAEEVANQLNALLWTGGNVTLERQGRGLQGRDGGDDAGGGGRQNETAGQFTLPWQQGQQDEDEAPPSAIVNKARIVPIARQNALLVLANPEIQTAVEEMIYDLDKPGRQVMISAIIAEVDLNDAFEFGLRVSSGDLSFSNPDNAIGASTTTTLNRNDVFGLETLFTSAVLDASVPVNILLQALDQETAVRVLQEPRVFTSDNQEATFFDGQDVRLSAGSTITDGGNESFDLETVEVGVLLNVRPRITAQRDVDMEISLELSTLSDVLINNQPIIDRRETTTQVIVKNQQTIVLSGIITESESKVKRKLPLLGDIPVVGPLLFTSYDDVVRRSELIAFITPSVIDNPSDNTEASQADLDRLEAITAPVDDQARDAKEHAPPPISDRIPALRERQQQRDDAANQGASGPAASNGDPVGGDLLDG